MLQTVAVLSKNDHAPSLTGHLVMFLILTVSSLIISMSSVDKLILNGSHCVDQGLSLRLRGTVKLGYLELQGTTNVV